MVWCPSSGGVHGYSHSRQPKRVDALVTRAALHVRPRSTLISTVLTGPFSPLHAAPRTTIGRPASMRAPFSGNAITLFTLRLVTDDIASGGTTEPGATAFLG